MEEFWTQIPPRSIIDEFISGVGTPSALTNGARVSHSKTRHSKSVGPETGRRLRGCAPSSRGSDTIPIHHRATEQRIQPDVLKRNPNMRAFGKMKWIILVSVVFVVLLGCYPSPKPARTPQELAKDYELIPPPQRPEEGSLWVESTSVNPYSDVKASRMGDIVTISVVESAQASKNATTSAARDSALEANWTGVFETLAKNFTINGAALPNSNTINFANGFQGQGQTSRTSSMTAFLTARVVHVFPNNQMVIRGAREVRANNETQYIFVQGVIRPEDISSNNVILSTYIADARIELTGYGTVSDVQHPGWMTRVLNWVWPF
jgi:flagellar L-ring protein precursor FlgH